VYLSMTRKYVGMPPVWVGFENYVRLTYDGFFQRAVVNSFTFTFASVAIKTVLGMGMALVLTSKIRFRSFCTGLLLIPWVARHVTLPGIRNIVMIVLLLSTIWTFNDFAIIYILTKGGPGGATMVLPVLTYEIAFGAQRLGEAIAVALYMLPPLAFVIIVLSNYMRKGRTR